MKLLIQNAILRGRKEPADILIEEGKISRVGGASTPPPTGRSTRPDAS